MNSQAAEQFDHALKVGNELKAEKIYNINELSICTRYLG